MVVKNRRQLEEAINDLIWSSAELRRVLVHHERANRSLAKLMSQGVPAIEALERIGAAGSRPEVSEAIERFENARHVGRVKILVVAVEEGSSLSAVAKALGFSRQLASRIASEVRR